MSIIKALEARISALEMRLAAVESARTVGRGVLGKQLEQSRSLPILEHGRRPKFWSDADVRDWLTWQHRRLDLATALERCREKYGASRTPSRSALHRYWQKLDHLIRTAA
jgi:hypothetical protein